MATLKMSNSSSARAASATKKSSNRSKHASTTTTTNATTSSTQSTSSTSWWEDQSYYTSSMTNKLILTSVLSQFLPVPVLLLPFLHLVYGSISMQVTVRLHFLFLPHSTHELNDQ